MINSLELKQRNDIIGANVYASILAIIQMMNKSCYDMRFKFIQQLNQKG